MIYGKSKNLIRITAFTLLFSLLSGCYDRRELDTLGIVVGTAIDKAERDGETKLTLQIANVSGPQSDKAKPSKGTGMGSQSHINITGTGKSIDQIIRNTVHRISRRAYMPHNQVIVFGEDFAKEGVRDSLDFFARAPEARMTLNIFVAKGMAADILAVEPEFGHMSGSELVKTLKQQVVTSEAPIVTEFEFIKTILSSTTAPVAPLVYAVESDGKKELYVGGCAVFKGQKMVGELNEKETRGLLWVTGKVKAGIQNVEVLGVRTSMEIRRAKSKIKPELSEDGAIRMKIRVESLVGLGDQTGDINVVAPENNMILLSETERFTKNEIQSALKKSKELNADIFGFGEYISRKYPAEWKTLEGKWDELYRKIEVDLDIHVKSDGSGRSVMPLTPEE
jgi:spore germination protein KC